MVKGHQTGCGLRGDGLVALPFLNGSIQYKIIYLFLFIIIIFL